MAGNLAISLFLVKNFEEGKSLLRKNIPVARRILGENAEFTLTMRFNYARGLYNDPGATLSDLRESVRLFEKIEPTAQRALGSAHPEVVNAGQTLQSARAALAAREAGKSVVFV